MRKKLSWPTMNPIHWVALLCLMATADRADAQNFGVQRDIVSMYLFHGADEKTYRLQLESRTNLGVDRIVEMCKLEKAQTLKLRLAAKGDLCRFYREIGVLREKTKGFDMTNQAQMQEAWKEISPLQAKIQQGLVGKDSLFERVLAATLTPEQKQLHDLYKLERQRAMYLAILRMTVADLEKSMPLLTKQRDELMDLLEKQPLPRSVPQGYEAFIGYIILSKAQSKDLATILDEKQMKVLKNFETQYAGFAGNIKW